METMDWDEFVRRGEERRERRDFPPKMDRVTLALSVVLGGLLVLFVVWGFMS